jgi:DUF4097 and DUF4098 domain-containing protein YvlB
MIRRTAATLAALILLPLAACSVGTTTEEVSYSIDQPVTALVVTARAASVAIVVGDGPVTVTEEHRYGRRKPATTHQVEGQTLRLTESGCGDDDELRCSVGYRIRLPKSMSADITASAGAVEVDGLSGNLHVATAAGSVEGRGLNSPEVTVETEAGALSLEFTKAPSLVRATTSLGAVELRLPGTTAYAVKASSEVGERSVTVDQDPASRHRIEVSTEVGAVKVAPLP